MPTDTQRRSLSVGLLLGLAVTLVVVGAMVLARGGGSAEPLGGGPGRPLPDIPRLTTLDGDSVGWEQWDGTPMVVNLWASWCSPCIKEMPDFESVHQQVGDRVAFIGVNTQDGADQAREMATQTGVTYALVRDARGDLLEALQGNALPMTVFVDAEGTIVEIHNGALTATELSDKISELFPA